MGLTCHEIGIPSLTFHGPNKMDEVFQPYDHFVEGIKVEGRSFKEGTFSDSVMQVDCIAFNKSTGTSSTKKLKCENHNYDDSSYLYICKLKNKPGELIIKKCIELKVPPGPLLGKLKAGENVTLPDGRIIMSNDVVGPEEKGKIFIVMECPSVDYIDNLIGINELQQFFLHENQQYDLLSLVVHFTPTEVVSDKRYQEWISKFHPNVKHILCNRDNPSFSSPSIDRLQTKLNLLDSKIFPLIYNSKSTNTSTESNIINAPTLFKYNLRPIHNFGVDPESIGEPDYETHKNEAFSQEGFSESLNIYQNGVLTLANQSNNSQMNYPEIVFLGTGSAIPNKTRNTSAILVDIDENTSFLMDCAENTIGQIFRFYGEEFENQLKKIKAIYISHLHADHHLGLLGLIKSRSLITSEKIDLIIPPVVNKWIQHYNTNVESISHLYNIIPCFWFADSKGDQQTIEELLNKLNLQQLRTVIVRHVKNSYGITFTTKQSNCKISYSGDCMPTEEFVAIGQNSDILIHEATMEDDLSDEAIVKQHSTTSQAIDVGILMKAKFTILTHFSQRYSKIPLFNEKFSNQVGIAFDNMRININDLQKLPLMLPVLKNLFQEHYDIMESKTLIKQKKKRLLDNIKINA